MEARYWIGLKELVHLMWKMEIFMVVEFFQPLANKESLLNMIGQKLEKWLVVLKIISENG